MSQIQVDNIYNKEATGSPNFPLGANVTGVVTATSFSGSGANLTGIDATALKDSNGTVRVQANSDGAVVTGVLTVSSNVSVGGTLTYEDVTNVDAVGVITARDGIKVTGGDVQVGTATTIDNSGINVTGVVTATSFAGSGANLTGIDAAPTVQATADGAIAAGDAVIVKSDGDVTKVVQTVAVNNPPAAGSNALIYTDNMRRPAACYIPDGNKVVAVAHNASSTNPLESFVANVTNAGVIGPWGSVDRFDTENVQAMPGLCYDTTNDKVVVLYYASTSNKVWSRVGTISGTNISWGSRVEVYSADSNNFRCQRLLFDPTNSKVIALYRRGGANAPNARVGTVSGTSISWGTESGMNSVESDQMDMVYDPDTQRIIGLSKDQSGSRVRTHVGTVSGTDITWGAEATVVTANGGYPTLAYDTKNNKVVVQYEDGNSHTVYKVGTVTGGSTNTISWSSAGTLSTTNYNSQEIFFDAFSERLISFVRDGGDDLYVASGSLSGSTITWSSFYAIGSTSVPSSEYWCGVILQNGIAATIAQAGSGYFESNTAILGTASSNATTDNFIGFARDAVVNDATVKIDVSGAVNASQSGLTAGEKYYVQKNGSLATTEDTPKVFAGTAISSSKLIVNDQQPVPTPTAPPWIKLHSGEANVPSGTATYSLYESFADHTDKKLWRIPFYIQSTNNNFSSIGLQLKISGTWKNSNYAYQWFNAYGDNEIANHSTSNDDIRFPCVGKEMGGEIAFYNPHPNSEAKLNRRTLIRVNNGWCVAVNWDNGGYYDQTLFNMVGGWRGSNAQLEGIRFSTGTGIGYIHYAVLASNGW